MSDNSPNWLQLCFDMIQEYLPSSCETSADTNCFLEIAVHAESIADYLSLSGESLELANLHERIGELYEECSVYDHVIHHYLQARDIKAHYFGENHIEPALIDDNIGLFYTKIGHPEKAIPFNQKAVNVLEAAKLKTQDLATAYTNLGLANLHLGKVDKALQLYHEAALIDEEILGRSHIDTAADYSNLGDAYNRKEEYKKALSYLIKAYRIKKEKLDRCSPNTAITLNNIGSALLKLGKVDLAFKATQQSLIIYKKVYGEHHSSTAFEYSNIAIIYASIGKYQKAKELLWKALNIQKDIFGYLNVQVARSSYRLGDVYYNIEDFGKALSCYAFAYIIFITMFEQPHSETEKVKNLLLSSYQKGARRMPFSRYLSLITHKSVEEQYAEITQFMTKEI